jgi:G protein-coupled receptor GPR1
VLRLRVRHPPFRPVLDSFIIDFAVLMIAIHSGLSVFQPGATAGVGGLYPYRHVAFVIWIAFPVLMASLAFLNPNNAYETGGVSCFLPTQPVWYNLAFNWVPRYINFLVILGIYASIYFYVHRALSGFGRRGNEESSLSPSFTEQRRKSDRPSRRH